MISFARSIANDGKQRDCKCFALVQMYIPVKSLVCIILEYAHCLDYNHPFARDGDLSLHADVTPHRSICRRTRNIKHNSSNSFIPRAVVTFTDRPYDPYGNMGNSVIFTAHLSAPRYKDITIAKTISLDHECIRFLFDLRGSPRALLEVIRHNNPLQKISVSMANVFFKACMLMRDELREIIYEIYHECPHTAQIYVLN